MAKMLVPALTLPVRGATELVATMPVPASPSGGHSGIAGPQSPGRIEQPGAGLGAASRRPPRRSDGRQQVGQPPGQAGVGDQVVEVAHHGGVVAAGGGVDREHAAGVADPEHLLAGQLPVHVPGEGGQVRDPTDVVLTSRTAW